MNRLFGYGEGVHLKRSEVFNLKVSFTRETGIGKRTKMNADPNPCFPGYYTDEWIKAIFFIPKGENINSIHEKVCVEVGEVLRGYVCVG